MEKSEVSFALGQLTFAGTGSEPWLATQLDKVIKAAQELNIQVEDSPADMAGKENPPSSEKFKDTLALHLKNLSGDASQNRKFLAVADWLRRKGKDKVKTSDVTGALKDAHQKRLGNASECLNQNVAKGFCEKDGGMFFLTPEGLKELGVD
jgi:hypothetical protein